MKTLVTGATGFIGRQLTRSLVEAGDFVRVLVRPSSDLNGMPLEIERHVGDLTDSESVRSAVIGMDRVFHCGAVVADWGDARTFAAVNVEGTRRLAEAALRVGVGRFVHVSSTDVYGHPNRPAAETEPFRYRGWPYGDTKIDAERAVLALAEKGLPLMVVRPATVYGPRAPLVKEFVHLLKTGEMMLIGGGRTDAGLCYVDNVVDALMRAGRHDGAPGMTGNVVDDTGVAWVEFVDRLAGILGVPPVRKSVPLRVAYAAGWTLEWWGRLRKQTARPLVTRMAVEILGTRQDFSTERIRREWGWTPRVSFDEGMRRIADWLRNEDEPRAG